MIQQRKWFSDGCREKKRLYKESLFNFNTHKTFESKCILYERKIDYKYCCRVAKKKYFLGTIPFMYLFKEIICRSRNSNPRPLDPECCTLPRHFHKPTNTCLSYKYFSYNIPYMYNKYIKLPRCVFFLPLPVTVIFPLSVDLCCTGFINPFKWQPFKHSRLLGFKQNLILAQLNCHMRMNDPAFSKSYDLNSK